MGPLPVWQVPGTPEPLAGVGPQLPQGHTALWPSAFATFAPRVTAGPGALTPVSRGVLKTQFPDQ